MVLAVALTTTGRRAPTGAPRRRRGPGRRPPAPNGTAGGPGPTGDGSTTPAPGAAGGTGGSGPASTAPVPRPGTDGPGLVAFASRRFGAPGIFVVSGDGTGEKRLTPAQGEYFTPVWSPDGTRIAFTGRRADNTDVYVMKADGSGERRLTSDAGNDFDPAWSPDGRRIAFTAQRGPAAGSVPRGEQEHLRRVRRRRRRGRGAPTGRLHRRRVRPGLVARRKPGRLHPRHRRRGGHLGGRTPTGRTPGRS